MKQLLKKEFLLCLHPTCAVFPLFALFVFIPNYPYEVMFFFWGLSVFFVCLAGRENGDFVFTCALPVKKRQVVVSRMLFCGIFESILFLLACVFTAIKQTCYSPESQINYAGTTANLAFLGYGLLLFGVFHLVFFPQYFKNPNRIGIPFVAAAAVQFLIIALLIVLRYTVPLLSEILILPDPKHMPSKAVVFVVCAALSAIFHLCAVWLSVKAFERTDI